MTDFGIEELVHQWRSLGGVRGIRLGMEVLALVFFLGASVSHYFFSWFTVVSKWMTVR